MMLVLPWVEISASATPDASTRLRMISTAWAISDGSICELSVVRAWRMIWRPPARSRPRPGVAPVWLVRMPTLSRAKSNTNNEASHVRDLRAPETADDTRFLRFPDENGSRTMREASAILGEFEGRRRIGGPAPLHAG